jgi:hypothetical protein
LAAVEDSLAQSLVARITRIENDASDLKKSLEDSYLLTGRIKRIEDDFNTMKTLLEDLNGYRLRATGVLLVLTVLGGALWTWTFHFITKIL